MDKKNINFDEFYISYIKLIESKKNDNDSAPFEHDMFSKPRNVYEELSQIFYTKVILHSKVEEYCRIFITKEGNRSNIQDRLLDKFNEGLKFSNPRIFQNALYYEIFMGINKLIEQIRNFCDKYKGEYYINIDPEWINYSKKNYSNNNEKFNKFIGEKYQIDRDLRNTFYAHPDRNFKLNSDKPKDKAKKGYNIFIGYHDLVKTLNEIVYYADKSNIVDLAKKYGYHIFEEPFENIIIMNFYSINRV